MNKIYIIAGGLLVFAALGYGGKKMYDKTRGLRNNNPGNIRHGANWQGMAKKQTDDAFIVFKSPEYGIRAMARVIHNYQKKHGINTIKGLVERWAPSVENDTQSYVQSVAGRTGISATAPIVFDNVMPQLVKAIIYHENGQMPYSSVQISKGIAMSGISV